MEKKSVYSKRLGNELTKLAQSAKVGKYHVIPSQPDRWGVVLDGSVKTLKAFTTKKDAVNYAKKFASANSHGEVIVHGSSGMIEETITL